MVVVQPDPASVPSIGPLRTSTFGDPMNSAIRGALVALALGLWPTAAWAGALSAEDVVRSALEHHPDTLQAAGAVTAGQARRQQVSTLLENPTISVGVSAAGSLLQGTLNQPISLTGEGWKARRAADAAIDAASFDERRTDLRIAAEARATYAWAVTTERLWKLSDEAMRQSSHLKVAVEARAAAGEAGALDVQLARMAEAEATARANEARRLHASARTALAAFSPEAATAELTADATDALPTPAAAATRSDVLAAEARVREAEADLAQQRAAVMPRVGIGLFFQRDARHGDPGDVGPQLTLAVPLWNRNQGAVGQAQADVALAKSELGLARTRAAAELAVLPDASWYADAALAGLGDVEADARAAIATIDLAWTAGEIDVAQAVLLRREVLTGWVAGLQAKQSTVDAQLDLLLAQEDPNLIPTPTTNDEEAR